MDQSELRLGNWVSYRGEKEGIVSNLGVHGFETERAWNGFAFGSSDVDEYEGIPLTPEWLEKAGAEKIRESRYFIGINPITDDYLMVIGGNADGFYFQNAGHPLRFVHQLQNLYFALSGEELQFKD